jgi:CRP-like cAMP-binding protein
MVLAEELGNVAFLRPFTPAYQKKLAGLARLKEYQADDVIFAEGEHCPEVYLVLDGEVGLEIRVPGCGMIEVHRIGPGGLLGWSPVLGGGAMTATAISATRCRVAALAADAVVALADHDPRFGLEFFRRLSAALAERLRATRLQIPESARDKFRALREAAD